MIIKGIPIGHWETGTEGILWAVQANWEVKRWSYDDLHVLKNDDHLIITAADGTEVFHGVIYLDEQACMHHLTTPQGTPYSVQGIQNMIVHGVQRGIDPDVWFGWFMAEKGTYLAELVREAE